MNDDKNFWEKRWQNHKQLPASAFARRVYAFAKIKKLKNVLDLGAGNGRDALYFAGKGMMVTAVDFAETVINKLKNVRTQLTCIKNDIRKINFPEGSFDIIYARLSLHYFDDRTTERIFHRLYKILRKKGLLCVACRSTDDPLCGKGKYIEPFMYKTDHVRHFFSKKYMKERMGKFVLLHLRKITTSYGSFIEVIGEK